LNENEKLMIFTTGSQTYQPHQVGIKLMSKVKFRTKLNIPENIFEAAEEARRKREEERESRLGRINFEPTPWSDYRQVAQMFDVVDVLIDFHGFVTGYGVSPDSRYLYVNIRPWPKDFEITDPWIAPPCGLATELVVVDLAAMQVVGRSKPAQRVFTCGEDIEQNNVQVTRHFVATTSCDSGMIIDRHTGVRVARLPHPSCSCCAVNPHNSEQAITVGEDGFVRQWTSKKRHAVKVRES